MLPHLLLDERTKQGKSKREEEEDEGIKKDGKGKELGPLVVWATDKRKRH